MGTMHPRAPPNIKRERVEVNGGAILLAKCFKKTIKLRKKHHDFERLLSVRGLPTTVFFLSTGPASGVPPLTGTTNSTKKQWKGHNELKTRFSNGPTKTEPLRHHESSFYSTFPPVSPAPITI